MSDDLDFDGARAAILAAAGLGIALAAEHVLGEAQALVPLEEGTLERSGRATADGLTASVSFDTPYAVRQHEDMTASHASGRTAKYLERAHAGSGETVLAIVGHAIEGARRGS